jgi:heptosyltransferase-1
MIRLVRRCTDNPLRPDPRYTIRLGARKKFLARLLSAAAAVLRCFNGLLGPRGVSRRIVLLEPFGLGDVISLQPLVDCLLNRDYEVVLCGKSSWKALFPPRPRFQWIDSELPWGTHDEAAKYRLSAYFAPALRQFLQQFREAARGGIGLDTRGDIRSTITLYLAGCSQVASLSHYLGSDLPVLAIAARIVPFARDRRRWELNLGFLDVVQPGLDATGVRPPGFSHLRADAPATNAIGLVAVAPWAGKLWQAGRWQQLIASLRQRGHQIRALCGPGQEALARQEVGEAELTACGSIEDWARELSSCCLIVSLDTGPMHLADALGIPVVALFGQGMLPLWSPSGPRSIVIDHQESPDFVPCQPVDENIQLGRKFMDKISVEEVLAAVLDRLHPGGQCPTQATRRPADPADEDHQPI